MNDKWMKSKVKVCILQMPLVLASTVILGSESRETRYRILLSQIRDFPFRRLLRLAGYTGGIRPFLHMGLNGFLSARQLI
jgi:hypothetical protein